MGLFITMVNLMPIGQLDGGHVARAALGESHEKWSARLHMALPLFGLAVGAVMFVDAMRARHDVVGALRYAVSGAGP